ncbi:MULTISPECIES: ROK family protein [unclassified Thioalkalivibrio]|uniref:glucokinase n=1 Tax=unclassified Thioalkalivibrio TaxID=2621013 RepID=UPI0003601846|nr:MULTISPECIES: ROK family protein [unclassified Thioalkalivibrio]
MDLIVADVGGTNTRVARARREADGWSLHEAQRYPSREHPELASILEHWRHEYATVDTFAAAGLAVAGPVHQGRARVTNLDWPALEAASLGERLGMPVTLLNDFAAIGASLDALQPGDCETLQHATPDPAGLRLVAGAGTGLGTCLVGPPGRPAIYPGEGGHARFSPAGPEEAALGDFVSRELGYCTREHLLSGRGIARIGQFELDRQADPELAEALAARDPAAAIGELARAGHPAAENVIDRFVGLYAGQLADMALTALPTGGIYLAGGIAPRWVDAFRGPRFRCAFRNRPPMTHLLEQLPVALIMHPEPGLLGAAVCASRSATP